MKARALLAGMLVLGLGLSSCQVLGQSEPPPEELTPSNTEAVATAEAVTPFAEVSPSPSPAVTPTPAETPTPAPPTATPTPTATPVPPSSALAPAVDGLEQKLAAFRSALASKNLERLSSAQLALLEEADRAEAALKNDKSPQANLVRDAIDDIRSGAAGQTRLLDAAAQGLSQAGGRNGTRSGVGTPSAGARSRALDYSTLANSFREKLAGYEQARRERNPENLLRRQKDLVDVLGQIQEATQDADFPEARQLRAAADDLRRALDGGPEKLDAALAKAREAAGATQSEDVAQVGDPATIVEPIQRKASAFKAAVEGGRSADLARMQKDLLDEIVRAEGRLKADSSPEADKARSALRALRDGASGDTAKLDGALANLAEITGQASGDAGTPASQSSGDLRRTAESVRGKVEALQEAIRKGSSGDQLRLQRELHDLVTKVRPGLEGDPSSQAGALRGALDAIGNGLAGDQQKLDEAAKQLDQVLGRSATPTAQAQRRQSSQSSVDLGPIRSSLDNRLSALEDALKRGEEEGIEKAQQDLRAEADRVADSLQKLEPATADRVRSAIGAAREAAGGDLLKVQAARETLKELGR